MSSSLDHWSGQSRGWRYLAQRIDGSGTPGPFLHNELPLTQVTYTDVNSGPEQITGQIDPLFRELVSDLDGMPILHPWQTVIWAEQNGAIVGGGLLTPSTFTGPQWSITGMGHPAYAAGQGPSAQLGPYVQVDPLDIVRDLWDQMQSDGSGDLGLILDRSTHTPIRIGDPPAGSDGTQQTSQSTANIVLYAPYTTTDIGAEIDKLAQSTPFEYHTRHQWDATKSTVLSYLDFGYPSIGRRRPERFVLGENIHTVPQALPTGDYANHVRVIGAGDGSAAIIEDARLDDGNLHRMVVISDTSLDTPDLARARARQELARRLAVYTLREVLVRDGANAELNTIMPGDEILVQTDASYWLRADTWYRVVSRTLTPATGELAKLTLDPVTGETA